MSSSMLTGDRRWASTKRGGMTVLGKVVVPKPINLPSQRSENHGLDPNVEIVPKGTLTWGNKSSSPWGASSPNTEGGSPSHVSGRPSSGSGTRPSTANSDRALDFPSNSRPASASGALTSSQSSLASLRPRSAETRPGSSQLSRFADNSEHPGAWSASGAAEKLRGTSDKNDGFSLTSVDFPTLGSEKDSSGKRAGQDGSGYGRPGSSSGGAETVKEMIVTSGADDVLTSESERNCMVNTWGRENPQHIDEGGRPATEKWQGNPHSYPGPPQHYEAWHGAPVNNPQGGVWFRGPPGPPYGNPVGPGGYPMEPFPYYRPQIPATGLPNSQPVPLAGAGPRGPHPKTGDMFRPHMPDSYMRPVMPVRPGFYPGQVPYEGYYNPQMNYCGPNERDPQYMGMPPGPPQYHRYPSQGALEPVNPHGKSGGYGPGNHSHAGEQPQDKRGPPYRVLLKQHDGWDEKNDEHRGEGVVVNSTRDQPRSSSWDDDWGSERDKEGEGDLRKPLRDETISVPAKTMSPRRGGNVKAVDESSGKNLEREYVVLSKGTQPVAAAPKDASLIQKIEGLNARARASDVPNEIKTVDTEDQTNKFQANTNAEQQKKEPDGGSLRPKRTHTVAVNRILDSTAIAGSNITRGPAHGIQSRSDHHGRGRFNNVEHDGRQNKPLIAHPPILPSPVHLETSNFVQDHHVESSRPQSHGKPDGQSMPPPILDKNDTQEQRAKMRELARQRTKQLQEEEDERTKRQMARARAKLEELNKRTLSAEETIQKLENAPIDVQNKQDESLIHIESSSADSKRDRPQSSKQRKVAEKIENDRTVGVDKPSLPSSEAMKSAQAELKVNPALSASVQQVAKGVNIPDHDNAPQAHERNVSKPKRSSLKQKHTTSTTEAPKIQADVRDSDSKSAGVVASDVVPGGGLNLAANSNLGSETSMPPRKKNSRSAKNKHKTEDKAAPPPSSTSKESLANVSLEPGQPKTALLEDRLDHGPVFQVQLSPTDADRPSEHNQLPQNEESHGRGNSHWKPQQSRRMPRSQQNSRLGEKHHGGDSVIWAPVRSQNKMEVVDEPNPQNVIEEAGPPVKPDNQAQNSSKNKRAEMERYVPKPVAKEMAQQGGGSTHQPVAPVVNPITTTDDSGTRAGSNTPPQVSDISLNAGVAVETGVPNESRSGNNRHNKQQGKAHSWWQRGSMEQHGSSFSSNVGQNVQKLVEPPQLQKPEPIIVKEQKKNSEVWDDWGISEDYVEPVPVLAPPVKDQKGVSGRGKRHSKGHRGNGNTRDHDQKKSSGEDTEKIQFQNQSSSPEMGQMDQSTGSKENRGDHLMPHWQPKPQVVPINNQRGNRHNSNQNYGSEVAWATINQVHRDQSSISERSNAEPAPNHRHNESRRERKPAPMPKGQPPMLANQHIPNPIEQEQRASSGSRKNGNQNGRFSQNHEAGDWNYSEQDNRQHNNPPPNRRQNQRYEYQPVGPYNNRSEIYEGPKAGSETLNSRGRGRGQNHSRRGTGGNSYGRQSGIRIETSFE